MRVLTSLKGLFRLVATEREIVLWVFILFFCIIKVVLNYVLMYYITWRVLYLYSKLLSYRWRHTKSMSLIIVYMSYSYGFVNFVMLIRSNLNNTIKQMHIFVKESRNIYINVDFGV